MKVEEYEDKLEMFDCFSWTSAEPSPPSLYGSYSLDMVLYVSSAASWSRTCAYNIQGSKISVAKRLKTADLKRRERVLPTSHHYDLLGIIILERDCISFQIVLVTCVSVDTEIDPQKWLIFNMFWTTSLLDFSVSAVNLFPESFSPGNLKKNRHEVMSNWRTQAL